MAIKKNPMTVIKSGSQPVTLPKRFEAFLRKMVIIKIMKRPRQYGLPCMVSLVLFFVKALYAVRAIVQCGFIEGILKGYGY
jgi:hypothetical protein